MRVAAVCGALATLSVSGQDAVETNAVPVAPVMVTSTLAEMELKEVPLSVSVVTSEEISRSAGTTVAEVLRDVPGVEIYDGGIGGMSRVSIRGESDRTLLMINGQRISEQKSMSGAPLLLSKADVDRIEVIKGPGSTLYGSEAIGGVVNIITKKAVKDGFHVSVGSSYHSGLNGASADVSVSGKEGAFSYYGSVMREDYGARDTPQGKVARTDSDATAYTAGADYDDGDVSAGVRFESFDSALSVYTDSEYMYMDLPEWSRRKVSGYVEKRDLSDHLAKIRLDAYFQNSKKDFINDINWARMMGMPPMFSWTEYKKTFNDQDSYGATLQADLLFGNHYLIAGADVMYDSLQSDDYSRTFRAMMGPPTTTVLHSTPDADKTSVALFAQDEWSFAEDWTLTAGYRANYTETFIDADSTAGSPSDSMNDSHGTFSVALVNTSFEDWAFRAGVSQGYRTPTLGELYTSSGMAGSYISGNPDLDPETSISYEVGVRWFTDSVTLDFAAFYTEAEDYIDYRDDVTAPTGQRWFNMDQATTFGGEALLKYDFIAGAERELAPYVSGTYLRRKYEDDTGSSTYKTGYPTLKGRAGLRGSQPFGGNLFGWADVYCAAVSEAEGDTSTEPGWGTFNMALGLDVGGGDHEYYDRLSFEVGVLNILDKEYTQARDSIMAPGRSVFLSVRATF